MEWGLIACWTICGILAFGNITCWIVVFRSRFFVKSNGHEVSIGEDKANEIILELKKENVEFKKENMDFKQEIIMLKQLLQKYLDGESKK